MSSTPDQVHADPPLWSIGIAAAIILVAPLILYSLAPTGPIREGDTVFSEGEQHAEIRHAAPDQLGRADGTCLLDPNSPLIVVQTPHTETDGLIVAEVQGNPTNEWPFCTLHVEVLLKSRQVFQKPAVVGAVTEILTRWFSW